MRIVIIGGDAAGMSAAMQIYRNTDPNQVQITVLERGSYYSYAQCGLPYVIEGSVNEVDDLIIRSHKTYQQKYQMDARIQHEVQTIDIENKTIHGYDYQNSQPFIVPYDQLLIATGADSIVPPIEGNQLQGIFTLKTIPDLQGIQKLLEKKEQVTIIGGGFIGLELAEALVANDKKVRMIEKNNRLLISSSKMISDRLEEQARIKGIELIFDEEVQALLGCEQQRVQFVETDKGQYETDMVIWAIGIKPNTAFVDDHLLKKATNGAIVVNEYMRTNQDSIYAAGDCATQYHRIKKENDYIPLGTHANKQGRVAGLNIAGQEVKFQGVVGTSIFRFFDLTVAKTGLSYDEATKFYPNAEKVSYDGTDIAGYFTGKHAIHIELIYESETKLLLGAEITGGNGVDKRIDVLSVALYSGINIDELQHLDLAYAPPYNGVWDPIQQAARRVKFK